MATSEPLHFDTIVIGVGSMGSAACWYLSKRGQRVLGLEQFDIPHERGSHAGQSRIIRKAYFEHPDYVPLLMRAYDNWYSFEKETGSQLYYRTGIAYFGKKENENIAGVRNSASIHHIPIARWTSAEARDQYPAIRAPEDFDVIFEPDAGFIRPELAVTSFAREAAKNGAVIKGRTPALEWRLEGERVVVATTGVEYSCDKLVITAGAWSSRMAPALNIRLRVTRQLLAWVSPPRSEDFSLTNFPCWFVEDPDLGTFYGFPLLKDGRFSGPIGLKLAHHFPGIPCDADGIDGPMPADEEEKLKAFLRKYIPSAGDNIVATKKCLYTSSDDGHFVIDHLPGTDGRVVVACGFSGHGFKFVPVIGEILADLAMKRSTPLPVGFLSLKRFE